MANNPKYVEQLERVIRWFNRFKDISEGKGLLISASQLQDDIFAFFLNCYHLKDWVKNDPDAKHLCNLVEPYINQSEALSICADLCNGLKHLTLSGSRSGQNPKFGPKVHRASFGLGPPTVSVGYLIETDKGKYDAFELAQTCIMDWETFFYSNSDSNIPMAKNDLDA